MTEGKLWATHLILAPLCHGVMGVPVHLLQESRHMGMICVAGRWAWSPLSMRVVLVANGSRLFMILGMPCTIPSMVHKWSSLHLFDSINSRVLGINSLIWPFHSLL
jgi:hypothetical protein